MKKVVSSVLLWFVVFSFVGTMLTIIIAIAIWPGEAKLVAPLFCPSELSDAVVVRDEYRPRPGETSINYSLHCVGERGEVEEIGFLRPFVVLSVIHGAIGFLLLFGLQGPRAFARSRAAARGESVDGGRRSRSTDVDEPEFIDASTAGPFVD